MESRPVVLDVARKCCGCGACVAACPVSCLRMEPDDLGFLHPVCAGGCVGCGRCAGVCPALRAGGAGVAAEGADAAESAGGRAGAAGGAEGDAAVAVWWAKARDTELRGRSSSGAVFGLLARETIARGGAVYGAAFAEGCRSVRHVRAAAADGPDALDALMRSKYVQSSVGVEVFRALEADLAEGRGVLFCGTSCQCAAVRNYLQEHGVSTEGLLAVDVICHGAPSPRLWAAWLDDVSRGAGAEVDEVSFRDKSSGWRTYSVAYGAGGRKVRTSGFSGDWYMRAFLRNASLRESCFGCPTKRRCGSDITLGDFWGIQNVHPEVEDGLGVSAVVCNTAKGVAAFEALRDGLERGESSFGEVLAGNPSLAASVGPYPQRERFVGDFTGGMGIRELAGRWTFEPSPAEKLRRLLWGLKRRILGD